jgi:hypothetical protein
MCPTIKTGTVIYIVAQQLKQVVIYIVAYQLKQWQSVSLVTIC